MNIDETRDFEILMNIHLDLDKKVMNILQNGSIDNFTYAFRLACEYRQMNLIRYILQNPNVDLSSNGNWYALEYMDIEMFQLIEKHPLFWKYFIDLVVPKRYSVNLIILFYRNNNFDKHLVQYILDKYSKFIIVHKNLHNEYEAIDPIHIPFLIRSGLFNGKDFDKYYRPSMNDNTKELYKTLCQYRETSARENAAMRLCLQWHTISLPKDFI